MQAGTKRPERVYKCEKCRDNGLEMFWKTINGMLYEYVKRCTCPAGSRYGYAGRGYEKCKSQCDVPGADDSESGANL